MSGKKCQKNSPAAFKKNNHITKVIVKKRGFFRSRVFFSPCVKFVCYFFKKLQKIATFAAFFPRRRGEARAQNRCLKTRIPYIYFRGFCAGMKNITPAKNPARARKTGAFSLCIFRARRVLNSCVIFFWSSIF